MSLRFKCACYSNEAEPLVAVEPVSPETVSIPALSAASGGRERIRAAELPDRNVHDLPEAEKVRPHNGTALERIGEDTAGQLDSMPDDVSVIRHLRPKYAYTSCRKWVKVAPARPAACSSA